MAFEGLASGSRGHRALAASAVMLALLFGRALPAFADVELVVEVADPAPMLAGVTFSDLELPSINAEGEIGFVATLSGTGITAANDETLWLGPPDDLRRVVSEGDAAPGTGAGITFGSLLGPPVVAPSGRVAIQVTLAGAAAGTTDAVYEYDPQTSTLSKLIRAGDPAPNTEPGVTFLAFFEWAYNDAGIAARATLTGPGIGPGNDRGIWTGPASGLTKLLRTGDAAPGYVVGTTISGVFEPNLTINPSGDVAFEASVLPSPGWAVYRGTPGNLQRVAAFGQLAPIAGCTFQDTGQGASTTHRSLGASGTVAFFSDLNCGATFESGLFAGSGGSPGTVATKSAIVPGFGGATWASFFEWPVGGNDQMAVRGQLTGGSVTSANDRVVLAGPAGALGLLAREGSSAPGTGSTFADFGPPFVDSSGRVSIRGFVSTGPRGIWYGFRGNLDLVALGGETYGTTRPRTLGLFLDSGAIGWDAWAPQGSGNADGLPSPISDNNSVVFRSQGVDPGGGPTRLGIYLDEAAGPVPAVPMIPGVARLVVAFGLLAGALQLRWRSKRPASASPTSPGS